jgi:hypothetical protein
MMDDNGGLETGWSWIGLDWIGLDWIGLVTALVPFALLAFSLCAPLLRSVLEHGYIPLPRLHKYIHVYSSPFCRVTLPDDMHDLGREDTVLFLEFVFISPIPSVASASAL